MATKVLASVSHAQVMDAQTREQFANIADDIKSFTAKKITSRDFPGFNGDTVEAISFLCEVKKSTGTVMMNLPGSILFNSKVAGYDTTGQPTDEFLSFGQWQELISGETATEAIALTSEMLRDVVVDGVEVVEETRPHVIAALNKQNADKTGDEKVVVAKYGARNFINYDAINKAHETVMEEWTEANKDREENMRAPEPEMDWDNVWTHGVIAGSTPNKTMKLKIAKPTA